LRKKKLAETFDDMARLNRQENSRSWDFTIPKSNAMRAIPTQLLKQAQAIQPINMAAMMARGLTQKPLRSEGFQRASLDTGTCPESRQAGSLRTVAVSMFQGKAIRS